MTLQKLINQNQQVARRLSQAEEGAPEGKKAPENTSPSKVKRMGSLVIKQQESKVSVNLNLGFLDRFEQASVVNEIEPWAEEDGGGLGYTVRDFSPDFNLPK